MEQVTCTTCLEKEPIFYMGLHVNKCEKCREEAVLPADTSNTDTPMMKRYNAIQEAERKGEVAVRKKAFEYHIEGFKY